MAWVALKTLIRRECGVIARYWFVTLAPPIIASSLYFVIFGTILGERIGPVDGVRYVEYMAPGLIALSAIPYAFTHTAAGLLGARLFRYLEETLVAPVPRWIILVAYVLGGTIRGLLVGIVTAAMGLLFSGLTLRSPGWAMLALLLVTLVAATAGFITAMVAKTFEQVTVIQGLVLVPLAILGGVFTPVSTLPHWARTTSVLNPIYYMVDAIRSGFVGTPELPAAVTISVVGTIGGALVLVALRLLARRPLLFEIV